MTAHQPGASWDAAAARLHALLLLAALLTLGAAAQQAPAAPGSAPPSQQSNSAGGLNSVVLFVALLGVIAGLSLIWVCWKSRTTVVEDAGRASDGNVQEPTSSLAEGLATFGGLHGNRRLVYVYAPGSGAPGGSLLSAAAIANVPHRTRSRPPGKLPTPQTIVANLPCMSYEHRHTAKDAAAAHSGGAAGSHSNDATVTGGNKNDNDNDNDDSAPQCVICCCAFEAGETIKLLPCLHTYHAECIDAWLQRDHVCPVCLADVVAAAGLSALHEWHEHQHAQDTQTAAAAATAPAQQQQQLLPRQLAPQPVDITQLLAVHSAAAGAAAAAAAPAHTQSSQTSGSVQVVPPSEPQTTAASAASAHVVINLDADSAGAGAPGHHPSC